MSCSNEQVITAPLRGLRRSRGSCAISSTSIARRLREIAGPAGRLEALLEDPAAGEAVRAAVVFAHPHPQYGGTMHTKVVYQAAKALGGIGCAVLRFNFRGAGKSAGAFSEGRGEMDDFRAGIDFMYDRYAATP